MIANNKIKIYVSFLILGLNINLYCQVSDTVSMVIFSPEQNLEFSTFEDLTPLWLKCKIYNPTSDTVIFHPISRERVENFLYKKNTKGEFKIQPESCENELNDWMIKLKTTILTENAFGSMCPQTSIGRIHYKGIEKLILRADVPPRDTLNYEVEINFPTEVGEYKYTVILKLNKPGFLSADYYFKIVSSNKEDSVIAYEYLKSAKFLHRDYEGMRILQNQAEYFYNKLTYKKGPIADYFISEKNELAFDTYFEERKIPFNEISFDKRIKLLTKDSNTIQHLQKLNVYLPYYKYHGLLIWRILHGFEYYTKEMREQNLPFLKKIRQLYFSNDIKLLNEFYSYFNCIKAGRGHYFSSTNRFGFTEAQIKEIFSDK